VIDRNYKLIYFNEKFERNKSLFTLKPIEKGISILPDDNSRDEWKSCFDTVMKGSEVIIEKNYFNEKIEVFDLIKVIPFYDLDQNITQKK